MEVLSIKISCPSGGRLMQKNYRILNGYMVFLCHECVSHEMVIACLDAVHKSNSEPEEDEGRKEAVIVPLSLPVQLP